MKKILAGLLLTPALMHCSSQSRLSTSVPFTKSQAWLVHVTQVFPKDGTMVPGTILRSQENELRDLGTGVLDIFDTKQIQLGLTACRNTIHWSLNSLVYPHEFAINSHSKLDKKQDNTSSREQWRYVILEPYSAFSDKALTGDWQDVYHLGGHQLSSQSIIIVPSTEDSYKEKVGSYKGTILVCEGGDNRALVTKVLSEKNVPVLYPDMTGRTAQLGSFCLEEPDQNVLIGDSSVKPGLFNQLLDLPADNGAAHYIQVFITRLSLPIRALFSLEAALETLLEKGACNTCKKTAKDLPKGTSLSQCAKCKKAKYCSKECQLEDWKIHKKKCALIQRLGDAKAHYHNDFVRDLYIPIASNNRDAQFIKEINDKYREALTVYTNERDQKHIKAYKDYCIALINYLYSDTYNPLRATFGTDPEGLLNYCKEAARRLAPLAELIETP